MKERILFIGVGQCGGNIANEFHKRNYNCMAINTSNADLDTIDVKCKYKIPIAQGCAKNRQKALEYIKDYYNDIVHLIEEKFPSQDIIYFVFSSSGGTGSGISPILADVISRKYYNKHVGAIMVLPSNEESMQCKRNTIDTYNQLMQIPNLKNIFILNNNSRENKFTINTEFADLFDEIVNITKPDNRGIIDKYELEKLLTCKGASVIMKLASNGEIDTNGLRQSIFEDYEKGCKYIGLSIKDNLDKELLENEFGNPVDTFVGYNDNENVIIVSGMPFQKKYITQLSQEIDSFLMEKATNMCAVFDIDLSKYRQHNEEDIIVKGLNFEELIEKYK